MANQEVPAGGGGRPQRRGYFIPDVRELMGIRVNKVPGDGNLNSEAYQTDQEKLNLYFEFLRTRGGLSEAEFQTVFESRVDQGDEINALNMHAGGICEEWSGMRREYCYLMLILKTPRTKPDRVPQILGDMRSIKKAIGYLREDLDKILKSVRSRNGTPLPFPKVFDQDMDVSNVGKVKKVPRK